MESKDYLNILKEQALAGKEVSMIVSGNSMSPFLEHGRDVIYFTAPAAAPRRGDMIFFTRPDGSFVMHRMSRREGEEFYAVGDNQSMEEGPFALGCIFAVVTRVKRKGRMIRPSDMIWMFFRYVWLNIIPLRRPLIRAYQGLSRLWK